MMFLTNNLVINRTTTFLVKFRLFLTFSCILFLKCLDEVNFMYEPFLYCMKLEKLCSLW